MRDDCEDNDKLEELLTEAIALLRESRNQLVNINLSASLISQGIQQLSELNGLARKILFQETHMAADLTSLTAQVQKNTTIEESAVTLIQGIAGQLAAAKNDPTAIQSLSDQLNASATDLSAAITANTPATV